MSPAEEYVSRLKGALTRRQFLVASVAPLSATLLTGFSLARRYPAGQTAARKTAAEDLEEIDVFVSGENGYHTYRIPSVITTGEDSLLAICEGRKTSRDDHGNIDLLMKRSTDGGRTWSEQQVIYEEGGEAEVTIGNPCPVFDQGAGTIVLPFCRNNRDVFVTKSTDEGRTWSTPVNITDQVKKPDWTWYATGPGIGIQMQRGRHQGRLVIPCDHREEVDGEMVKMSHTFYSDDGGETWELGDSVALHTDECQVAELEDGRLMVNMRNYWERDGGQPELGNKRVVSFSEDGGETWSDLLFDETLIEPVCQASLIRYQPPRETEESWLLFSNPADKERRIQMTARLSYDGGRTWPVERTIFEGGSAYSCLTELPGGAVGCLYEKGEVTNPYRKITFARFGLSWLRETS